MRSMRRGWAAVVGVTGIVAALMAGLPGGAAAAGKSGNPPALVADPASLVNPFIGTSGGNTFPGADYPFGMVQWSPETTPGNNGGYNYGASLIKGFSLTHLSGVGCGEVYGDIPFLPTVGALPASPATATEAFSHDGEQASAGEYSVTTGSPGVRTQLSVTPRSGMAQFTYPASTQANMLIKTGDSGLGNDAASATIVGNDEVVGSATSGHLCSKPGGVYTVYFAVQFSEPFVSFGTWDGSTVTAGSRSVDGGTGSGAYVSFDTTTNQTVQAKVGISFVSVANARLNVQTENPGWDFSTVQDAAHDAWNNKLNQIQIGGGSRTDQQTFYTALYHSLLFPSIFSDVNGQYTGFDAKLHTVAAGHASYANYSLWDTYRSTVQLASLVAPQVVSDQVQTMVDDYQQTGMLPKWSYAHREVYTMVGDPADPIIASAYAFGARNFDTNAALSAMVGEATQPNNIRPGLNYLQQLGYLPVDGTYGCCGDAGYSAATTLEYNTADFAIGAFAHALGNSSVATAMTTRAQDWQNLYNPGSGFVQPKQLNGQFIPFFNPASQQPGFIESNAYTYTTMVPFNLHALITATGGNQSYVKRLDDFFTKLNAGWYEPFYQHGNEPGLAAPWEYDYAGAPYKTQAVVRRIQTQLYSDTPSGLPGDDDLGAMSSWYVWSALGMYPETPGTADLALGSPLFPRMVVHLASGATITINAPQAAAGNPYVQSLKFNGVGWPHSYLPPSVVSQGATLDYTLGSSPNTDWAAGAHGAPPSYSEGQLPALGFAQFANADSEVFTTPDTNTTQHLVVGVQNVTNRPQKVTWSATTPEGMTASTRAGVLHVAPGGAATAALTVTAPSQVGSYPVTFHLTADGVTLPDVVVVVAVIQPGDLTPFYNNIGISNDDNQAVANFDGSTHAYSEQALTAAGLAPGATVTSNGVTYTWPDVPSGQLDNIVGSGQTINLVQRSGQTKLGFLGSSSNGAWQGTVTITYTDGTTEQATIGFSDWGWWGGPAPGAGDSVVAVAPRINSQNGSYTTQNSYVYSTTVPIQEGKTVSSVTLPDYAAGGSAPHVFAIATG